MFCCRQKNGSIGGDGIYNMATASDDHFGTLSTWNYQNHTGFYEGECGRVGGSAGELFPMNRDESPLHFFSSELCRQVSFRFEQKTSVKGVMGNKYTAGPEVFDNGKFFLLHRIKEDVYC